MRSLQDPRKPYTTGWSLRSETSLTSRATSCRLPPPSATHCRAVFQVTYPSCWCTLLVGFLLILELAVHHVAIRDLDGAFCRRFGPLCMLSAPSMPELFHSHWKYLVGNSIIPLEILLFSNFCAAALSIGPRCARCDHNAHNDRRFATRTQQVP